MSRILQERVWPLITLLWFQLSYPVELEEIVSEKIFRVYSFAIETYILRQLLVRILIVRDQLKMDKYVQYLLFHLDREFQILVHDVEFYFLYDFYVILNWQDVHVEHRIYHTIF